MVVLIVIHFRFRFKTHFCDDFTKNLVKKMKNIQNYVLEAKMNLAKLQFDHLITEMPLGFQIRMG